MLDDDFIVGKQRHQIEDSIVARFRQVDFNQENHAYLDDTIFWDFVFSWYELVRYYELSTDTTIGAHMLNLFAECAQHFRQVATNRNLRERRRDKAADALYQITYYVNRMIEQAQRNGIERASAVGDINWRNDQTDDKPNNRN